jgi:uncharacterized protein YndB with AHSA1/START domain
MSVINKSVTIKAPVGKVFNIVTSPENWTRFVASLVDVRDLSPDAPAKGSTFRWTYKMIGLKFSGDGIVTEYSKNKRFGFAFKSKSPVSEHYDFINKGDGVTELKVSVEFEMSSKILKAFADIKLLTRLNGLEAKNILEKIKVMCET